MLISIWSDEGHISAKRRQYLTKVNYLICLVACDVETRVVFQCVRHEDVLTLDSLRRTSIYHIYSAQVEGQVAAVKVFVGQHAKQVCLFLRV
jgi:hypothetical protein